MFAFLRKCQAVCKLDVSFYIPTNKCEDSIFSTSLSTLVFVSVYYNHPSRCDVVLHFGFTLCFSNDAEDISTYLLTICIASLVKHLFKSLVHLQIKLFVFLV